MEYWKKYRDDLYKQVYMFEEFPSESLTRLGEERPSEENEMQERFRQSVCRARGMIEQYALCNDWEYFGTFTLNKEIRDRTDLDAFRKDFVKLVQNTKRDTGQKIDFLLVPELHKDGENWHMHGLFNNLPEKILIEYRKDEGLPGYIRKSLVEGKRLYFWEKYQKKFGWNVVEPVRERDRAARYITKYVGKGMYDVAAVVDSGKHLYYVSKGLKKAEKIKPPAVDRRQTDLICTYEKQYEYCIIRWYKMK